MSQKDKKDSELWISLRNYLTYCTLAPNLCFDILHELHDHIIFANCVVAFDPYNISPWHCWFGSYKIFIKGICDWSQRLWQHLGCTTCIFQPGVSILLSHWSPTASCLTPIGRFRGRSWPCVGWIIHLLSRTLLHKLSMEIIDCHIKSLICYLFTKGSFKCGKQK